MKSLLLKSKLRYRYAVILLQELVKTDFKLRYQNSLLGYLWSLLKPLFLFVILYMVFVRFLRVDFGIPNPAIYLLLGIVTWGFFAEATGTSVASVVGKGDLMRKLNFPRYVIVIANTCSAIINLLLYLVIVSVFMIIARLNPGVDVFLSTLLFVELIALALGLSFFLSAAYVKLRDVAHIWEVILQAFFYLTPILYPLSLVPESARKLLIISPIAQIVQDLRYLLVSDKTTTIGTIYGSEWARLIPISMVVLLLVSSAFYFKFQSKHFAEKV